MATPFDWQRKKLSLNNACDLVLAGETGDSLFLSSRARNQFLENRELYLGCVIKSRVFPSTAILKIMTLKIPVAAINKLHIRCSFGGGEWRDGAESCQNRGQSF